MQDDRLSREQAFEHVTRELLLELEGIATKHLSSRGEARKNLARFVLNGGTLARKIVPFESGVSHVGSARTPGERTERGPLTNAQRTVLEMIKLPEEKYVTHGEVTKELIRAWRDESLRAEKIIKELRDKGYVIESRRGYGLRLAE